MAKKNLGSDTHSADVAGSTTFEKFAKAFKTESYLRQNLAELFSRTPRIQGVQITHGQQEYGKDIIFYSEDAFGDFKLNACVVKNGKISGTVEDLTAGAPGVFLQLQQVFSNPHVNNDGENEYVSHAYIISPEECSQTTMNSIKGQMQQRSGQVTFLCGRLLMERFGKFWPEFLIFESTLLGTYVARVQKGFAETDPIAFLMSQHQMLSGEHKSLQNVYVAPRFLQTLEQVKLTVEAPRSSVLSFDSTEGAVIEFAKQLDAVATLLANPQAWDSDTMSATKTVADLTALREEVQVAWNRAYEEYRKTTENTGGKVKAKSQIFVDVTRFITRDYSETIESVNTAVQALRQRIDAANNFAKKKKSISECLQSKEYLEYCAVQELYKLAPASFEKIAEPVPQYLPENLPRQTAASLLITAPAGFGKTSFCRWNFLNDVRAFTDKTGEVIPIYVPLHQLANSLVTSPEEAFFRSEEVQELVQTNTQKKKIRLFLDGLDEVTTLDQQRKLMLLAKELSEKMTDVQIIVTGRDYVSGPWLRWLPRINLAELTDAQASQLIKKWLGDSPDDLKQFEEQLRQSSLEPHMRVPLLATLIIAVFRRMQALPMNRVQLYEMFVDLMCGGWDVAKNVKRITRFGSSTKLLVLTRIAGLLHLNNRRIADESNIRTALNHVAPALVEKWRNVLDELLEDGLIVRFGASYTFAHLSFQEFLAAKDLNDPNGNRQTNVLRNFLSGNDWWREVLSFYVALSKQPSEIESWMAQTVYKMSRSLRSKDIEARCSYLFDCMITVAPGWAPSAPALRKIRTD